MLLNFILLTDLDLNSIGGPRYRGTLAAHRSNGPKFYRVNTIYFGGKICENRISAHPSGFVPPLVPQVLDFIAVQFFLQMYPESNATYFFGCIVELLQRVHYAFPLIHLNEPI